MSYAPTYRYAVGIFGANYAAPDQMEPSHWVMAQTVEDAKHALIDMRGSYTPTYVETGAGERTPDTPTYGDEGDGAYIYRVDREHPDFSEVLDEPGDRARHAFGFVSWEVPTHRAEFGPRGGLTVARYS